ncbi:type II toxin-antitoxin system Phd/YefM family antitoxin [Anaerococcus sp. DFU013_CI05]|uniref:type II toxin-antitoxin system Phd/YefM family antitoxin n=1 Tax=unclassified Anaerococcus TaxID=2614126 RepID=UPI001932803E|nr:type II toxin-antitoxin system Phd/YefM family antitoxin [Anaerococcus sp. mt242]MBM0046190.1 type II toxin-antitoxin system Phd/YefM family antitoxin [Anaerococcus sp. mt242]
MKIDTKTMVSITEANQNFSKVARLVDEMGSAVIMKNNAPKYVLIEYEENDDLATDDLSEADDELLKEISDMLLKKNAKAYKKLAE